MANIKNIEEIYNFTIGYQVCTEADTLKEYYNEIEIENIDR